MAEQISELKISVGNLRTESQSQFRMGLGAVAFLLTVFGGGFVTLYSRVDTTTNRLADRFDASATKIADRLESISDKVGNMQVTVQHVADNAAQKDARFTK